jgi:hypothetical protein
MGVVVVAVGKALCWFGVERSPYSIRDIRFIDGWASYALLLFMFQMPVPAD